MGSRHVALGRTGYASDIHGMTSSASTAVWLPAALAAVYTPSAPAPAAVRAGGRHAAPETPGVLEIVAAQARPGRHLEPEWSREIFDGNRDEDPFEWLGFGA